MWPLLQGCSTLPLLFPHPHHRTHQRFRLVLCKDNNAVDKMSIITEAQLVHKYSSTAIITWSLEILITLTPWQDVPQRLGRMEPRYNNLPVISPDLKISPHPVLYEIHSPTKLINYTYDIFHVCPSQHQRKEKSPLSYSSFSCFTPALSTSAIPGYSQSSAALTGVLKSWLDTWPSSWCCNKH